VPEAAVKASEWLESMEMYLREQLTTSMWHYYLFLQTSEVFDWTQPLLTVSQGLRDVKLWAAAETSSCFETLVKQLSNALLQFVGVS
jgi:hypothetical protein